MCIPSSSVLLNKGSTLSCTSIKLRATFCLHDYSTQPRNTAGLTHTGNYFSLKTSHSLWMSIILFVWPKSICGTQVLLYIDFVRIHQPYWYNSVRWFSCQGLQLKTSTALCNFFFLHKTKCNPDLRPDLPETSTGSRAEAQWRSTRYQTLAL